jgi:hypothetical protein
MECGVCNGEYIMTSHQNPRNGKWTALPLEEGSSVSNSFEVSVTNHEAFGIMGDSLGEFPISFLVESGGNYRPHNPSHFLGDVH